MTDGWDPRFDDDDPTPPPTPTKGRERTDDGNALRLVDLHGHAVRYCPQRMSWLAWTGSKWTWDAAGHVAELARQSARDLPRIDKGAIAWRSKSLMHPRISAAIALARSDARVVVNVDQLDARPYELNTPAGVVDLRTGQLRRPDPDALHTRSTAVAPDFDGLPARFEGFLAQTFAGDPTYTTYVQRLLGLSLVGQVLEQILPFAHGPGANGKTTLLEAAQRVVGLGDEGYSITAPAELLVAGRYQGHPTEIARLAGARLVVTSELDEGQRFAEAKVKSLTGRDVLAGRFMNKDFFNFVPSHTLWLLANTQPDVRTGGDAFWRRIRLLPFLHTVPREERDPHLAERLVHAEGPAILAWIIRGAAAYLADGLAEPDTVLAATQEYAAEQDTIAQFVDSMCDTGEPHLPHLRVRASVLHDAYVKWCAGEGVQPDSQRAFTFALRGRFGVKSDSTTRDKQGRWYEGIRLSDIDDDPGPDEPADAEAQATPDTGDGPLW